MFSWEYNGTKIFELFLSIYKWNRNLHRFEIEQGFAKNFY